MPTLRLRQVGMTHAIEGLIDSGLDADALLAALQALHGPAAVGLGVPIDGVLLDRSARSWPDLLDWVAGWVRDRGFSYAAWTGAVAPGLGTATLHFHE
jgi:hypothetical protein